MCVMLFNRNDAKSHYVCRARKACAETRFMDTYVAGIKKALEESGKCFAVFIEPMLPTGYPDCVVVEYDAKAYDHNTRCVKLSELDRKIRFVLMMSGGKTLSELSSLSGYSEQILQESLCLLREAGLARCANGAWHSVKKRNGIKKVTAIEAKLTGWRRAVEQAVIDSTFANETYILMPRATKQAMEYAAQSGVGIYCQPSKKTFSKALDAPLDAYGVLSYIGLYFDEWIRNRLSVDMKRRRANRVCV